MKNKRKRTKDVGTMYFVVIVSIAWLLFYCLYLYMLDKKAVLNTFGAIMWSIVSVILGVFMYDVVKVSQQEEILEFIVYEFEYWDGIYVKRYIYDTKYLMSQFIFTRHVKDYEACRTEKEMSDCINGIIIIRGRNSPGIETKKNT